MSFLNPAILGALGLVGIPLLIHLIRRRKLKIVRWAAMEFLRQSQKRQKRRLRIEEMILLLLRMLIVALAVLAFARPVLRAIGIPLLSQNAHIYAVFVVDNSFSMAAKNPGDGKTSFERAQTTADDILSHLLKNGDSVSVVLLSTKPTALIEAPTYDRDLARRRIRAVRVVDRGTDYFATAQIVDRLLKASKAPVKEVYWLTDDQASGWSTSKRESARVVWSDIGKQARLTWISVGAPFAGRENLAVETPSLDRELVTPQLSAGIGARIFNYGDRTRSNVLVNLIIDNKPQGSATVSIPAGKFGEVHFSYRFVEPGVHTGRIELADSQHVDGLATDNQASFVIRCRDRIKVLLQDMHPASNPMHSESFYLYTAMAPSGAAESLAPKLREGIGFGDVHIRDYDAVVIVDMSDLSSADRAALADYVKAGGGLLLFPGPDTDAHSINSGLAASGLLPATLGQRKTFSDEQAATLDPASIRHPALTMFKETSSVDLGSARFQTYYALDPISDASDPNMVQVMVRFQNKDAAFVERRVGLGKVILAASGAGEAWNQLPLKASSYVPLVYQLLSYIGQGPTSHRNLHQDEPMFLSLPLADANKPVRITAPDGHPTTQNSVLDARGVTFTYPATDDAGIYHIRVPGSNTSDAFAVALPQGESDLSGVDPGSEATQAGLPSNRLILASTPAQVQAAVRSARYGAEFWRWLIIAGCIPLLFVESFLAQAWGRRG